LGVSKFKIPRQVEFLPAAIRHMAKSSNEPKFASLEVDCAHGDSAGNNMPNVKQMELIFTSKAAENGAGETLALIAGLGYNLGMA
jgi:hypothetical protein